MDLGAYKNPYELSYHDFVRSFTVDEEQYPYYSMVPKNVWRNLAFRKMLREEAANDTTVQEDLWNMCRRDTLFWINSFCWLFEPRPRPLVIPFVTWPNQDPAIAELESALGHRDVGIEKSRGEGASWICLMVLLKYWIFGDPIDSDIQRFAFGLVSRTEEAVDDPDDPDSLMWKLDFQLRKLPNWMVPKLERKTQKHLLKNRETESTIVGYSAVGDVASGGRKTAFLMDEMAKFKIGNDYAAMSSTQYVTDCRFVVSTFKGNHGYYYDAMRGPESSMKKVILDWKDNPTRNRGLYTINRGHVKPLSQEINPVPDGYGKKSRKIIEIIRNRGFQIESKIRSPWYDEQCVRTGATPASIAEELDRDPERSGSPFFDPNVLQRLRGKCTEPHSVGNLDYVKISYLPDRFIENPRGDWRLWTEILATGRPGNGEDYVMGIDVAAGGGGALSSNSCISVSTVKGNKVAEFASPRVLPQDLARMAYAAGSWFKGPGGPAFLVFESNGSTGAQFAREIIDLDYPRLYLDKMETTLVQKHTLKPGFHNQAGNRGILYGGYRQALADGFFLNPSATALEECKYYEHTQGGGIEHTSAANAKQDNSGAGHNHGDRATADALCWWGINYLSPKRGQGNMSNGSFTVKHHHEPTVNDKTAPPGSFLGRRIKALAGTTGKEYW